MTTLPLNDDDIGSDLEAALLVEMLGLTPGQEDELGAILAGVGQAGVHWWGVILELTPEILDQIEAIAPGLSSYLHSAQEAFNTGDVSTLNEDATAKVLTATGYKPEVGPEWDLSDIDFDGLT